MLETAHHLGPTLEEVLNFRTVDELKKLIAILPSDKKPTKKADFVAFIQKHLKDKNLQDLFNKLDSLQQRAVAEAVYNPTGFFDGLRFKAKYGKLPVFNVKGEMAYDSNPSPLQFFIHPEGRYGCQNFSFIPFDLKQRLQKLVKAPEAIVLESRDVLPEKLEQKGVSLVYRDTERDALIDLPVMLRLVETGRVKISEKTLRPSLATIKLLSSQLSNQDFYDLKPKNSTWEQEIGPIKSFSWPLLLQVAKLAEPHGNKLTLTKNGYKALSKPVPDTLRWIYQCWLKTKLFDEFNRINEIKGQSGKGKRNMTAVADRRRVIKNVLCECPVDRWVRIDDLWRYMQVNGFDFEVTHNPWHLYISNQQYGSLGYDGCHDWSILQGRYVLCALFEYAATIGIVDVAYTDPEGSRSDYRDIWGVDDLSFLSRYDGLLYIRLNPLGAYCLGLTDEHTSRTAQAQTTINTMPSLCINIVNGNLSPEETLFLENYAYMKSETTWQLDCQKTLTAIENGHQIAKLRDFLEHRDDQPLPETVESFINTTEYKAKALSFKGVMLLIECKDANLAKLILETSSIKSWCKSAGERHLVIPASKKNTFHETIHQLGYGVSDFR